MDDAAGRPAARWLTTEQAAAHLGVKPATLYAYVSRGLLTSRRSASGRGSVFHVDDIGRLAVGSRGRAAARTPEVLIHSAITDLADGRLRYRGHDATALAAAHPYEAVAELLWSGGLADTGPWQPHPRAVDVARTVVSHLPESTPTLERLRVACTAAAAADPLAAAQDPDSVRATGRALIATLVDALPAVTDAPEPAGAIASRLWARLRPGRSPKAGLALLDAALVLLADHELAASTLSVRVAASARCDPYAAVECGLAAASGGWHGRSTVAVERLLLAVQGGRVDAVLAEQLRDRGGLPGFGHTVHRSRDPRAERLLQLLGAAAVPGDLTPLDELLAAAADRRLGPPNVDLALSALTVWLGMPVGSAEAVFGVARCAGWLAHAFEQYEGGQLIRPRAVYVGPSHPSSGAGPS